MWSVFGKLIDLFCCKKSNKVFKVELTLEKSVGWTQTPLDLKTFNTVRKKLGASLNDLMMVLIAQGLKRYFEKRDMDLPRSLTTSQPANLREDYDTYFGNKFGFFLLDIPMKDTATALKEVIKRSKAIKGSPEKWMGYWTSKWTTYLPQFIQKPILNAGTSLVNCAITNVRGPPMELSICDNKITGITAVLNPPPGVCLGYGIFSYNNKIWVSAHADKAFCSDAQELIDGLLLEYEELKATTLEA